MQTMRSRTSTAANGHQNARELQYFEVLGFRLTQSLEMSRLLTSYHHKPIPISVRFPVA